MEVFNRNSSIMVEKMLRTKETINVHSLITLCTLDIICGNFFLLLISSDFNRIATLNFFLTLSLCLETAMGTKVEAQNNESSAYVKAVHK